jgi:hypothetical protein
MKLAAVLILSVFCLTACDKKIHEARLHGDQAITRSSVSHSGLTYSEPKS